GENISSVEVEGILLRHPAVQEVAVVGMPDERWGEAPHAFVVLKSGASATEDELREVARERRAHFKVPQSFQFVAELPKTATGKIQKYVLKQSHGHVLPLHVDWATLRAAAAETQGAQLRGEAG